MISYELIRKLHDGVSSQLVECEDVLTKKTIFTYQNQNYMVVEYKYELLNKQMQLTIVCNDVNMETI